MYLRTEKVRMLIRYNIKEIDWSEVKWVKWAPKKQYYGMYMFVINWMNKLLRHEQEQEQALLHNIIEYEVINFILKSSILTLLDDQ